MPPHMDRIENVARLALGDLESRDPLPPGPNYGPFGYFRLALLLFAGIVAILVLLSVL